MSDTPAFQRYSADTSIVERVDLLKKFQTTESLIREAFRPSTRSGPPDARIGTHYDEPIQNETAGQPVYIFEVHGDNPRFYHVGADTGHGVKSYHDPFDIPSDTATTSDMAFAIDSFDLDSIKQNIGRTISNLNEEDFDDIEESSSYFDMSKQCANHPFLAMIFIENKINDDELDAGLANVCFQILLTATFLRVHSLFFHRPSSRFDPKAPREFRNLS